MPLGLATASSWNKSGLPGENRTSFGFRLFWVPRNVSPNMGKRTCVWTCSAILNITEICSGLNAMLLVLYLGFHIDGSGGPF